ncbi:MAG TPA: glycosyltransferase family A protein, partial [Verrucomicrobiae bacterium]|nr:glycosyltransferase family A protein [Verrucomicrobiae bacterium]
MISIAIPAYNRSHYIRSAIQSCLDQTHPDFEVVLGDSSPHGKIREIAESFRSSRLRYLSYDPSTELTAKLNLLLNEARGEWMLILCDDDLLAPQYLDRMLAGIREFPQATLFRPRYRLIDSEGQELRVDLPCQRYMSPVEFVNKVLMPEKYFFKMNITGILFRREHLLSKGGFPVLPVPWHTDRLTWTMLASQGGCVFDAEPTCSIRLHAGSVTSSFVKHVVNSVDSDLKAKRIFMEIIEELDARYASADEKRLIASARINLVRYMGRHLSRTFDH